MKISFSTLGCPRWSWQEILATACDLGYSGIEVRGVGKDISVPSIPAFSDENLEKTKADLKRLNLTIPCLDSDCCIHLRETEKATTAEIKAYILLAQKLDVPYVRIMATAPVPQPVGAVDEAYVLSAPELMLERVIHTKHPCFAASFWQEGLLLVCAAEGDDIQTAVYTLPARGMRPRRLLELPGQPGGLCVCPDGRSALISTRAGLMKLEIATGELKWNLPEWPLCMRLCCQGAMALVSGTLNGQVCLLSHYKPWLRRTVFQGTEAQACFLPEDGIVSGETAHP